MPDLVAANDIKAPSGTKKVKLIITALAVNMQTALVADTVTQEIAITYQQEQIPQQQIEISLQHANNSNTKIAVVAALRYYKSDNERGLIQNMKWLPADIIWIG